MRCKILSLAIDDIKEIHEYLSDFGETPQRKFRMSFEAFCDQIVKMPYMYSQYEHNNAYRRAVIVYDYLIFYQVNECNEEIKIYRVLHGKREIKPLLDN